MEFSLNQMRLTKTLKFKLRGLIDHEKYVLNQTRRQFRKSVNFYLYQIQKKSSITRTDYKKEYQEARNIFQLNSALVQQSEAFAINQYKSYKNNENNDRFPHFSSFVDVRYDNRTITFKEENEETHELKITLATTQSRVEATLQGGKYCFEEFQAGKFCDARLRRQNGEWYLKIHVKREAEIQDAREAEYYIGIDLGVNNLTTIAVQNRKGEVVETKFFDGSYVSEKKRRFNAKRREYMRKGLWSKLKQTRGKEKRFIKDVNHKISKYIKDLCEKYKNSTVVMENLDGIRDGMNFNSKQNRRLHNWSFGQLQEYIIYKAHEAGSSYRRVPPFNTSQVCGSCFGFIDRSSENKIVGACETCKQEVLNVDLNAAVNIIQRLWYYITRDIYEDTASQTELREFSSEGSKLELHQGSFDGKADTAAIDSKNQLVSSLSLSLP